jgi:hypothetical protein
MRITSINEKVMFEFDSLIDISTFLTSRMIAKAFKFDHLRHPFRGFQEGDLLGPN